MSLAESLISGILHPIKWFATQRVNDLSETIAIRKAVLREIVRLNVELYSQQNGSEAGLDRDRVRGISERLIAELQNRFDWSKNDPEEDTVRTEIKKAVTKAIVPLAVWLKLKLLRGKEPFDAKLNAALEFRDETGATNHSIELVAALQKHFIFFKPFAFSDPSNGADCLKIRDANARSLGKDPGSTQERRFRGTSI